MWPQLCRSGSVPQFARSSFHPWRVGDFRIPGQFRLDSFKKECHSYPHVKIPSGAVLNGTLFVNTTAIQTTVNCEASQSSTLNTPGTGNFTIQATNSAGCTAMATFNPGQPLQPPWLPSHHSQTYRVNVIGDQQHSVWSSPRSELWRRRRSVPANYVLVFPSQSR